MSEVLAKPKPTGSRNPVVPSGYDARVEPVRQHSRKEVESLLQSRTESISSRLAALQKEAVDTGATVKKAVTDNVWLGVGAALVGGIAVGLLLTRRSSPSPGVPSDPDGLADVVTRTVRSALDDGVDPTPAVATLLKGLRQPVVEQPVRKGKNHSLTRTIGFTLLELAIRRGLREWAPKGSDGATEG